MFLKIIQIFIIFLISLSSFADTREDSIEFIKIAKSVYAKSVLAAGKSEEMAKRSMVLLKLYLDSGKQFKFAYAISHLTLAIERSATTPAVVNSLNLVGLKKEGKAWKGWGEDLKELNRMMVARLHFAYFLTKKVKEKGIHLFPAEVLYKYPKIQSFYDDTKELFESLNEIHDVFLTNEEIQKTTLERHFETFVTWEHLHFFQPKIEKKFNKLPWMLKYLLKNIPGRIIEVPMDFILKARTTLNLKCLGDVYLKTENFMDASQRISQARQFYKLMEKIDFDPNYECYKDDYYVNPSHWAFTQNPEEFVKEYYDYISFNRNDGSTKAWLADQYRYVPVNEFAAIPSLKIEIIDQDRDNLKMNKDAIDRNRYINRTYHNIGNELARCTGTEGEIGNWYHFATWASVSGGKVIDGTKFYNLNGFQKGAFWVAELLDMTHTRKEQIDFFKRANALIAIEMIPLGRKFLEMFCTGNEPTDFSKFQSLLKLETEQDRLIRDAFYNYYKAIYETDINLKIEYVALAATKQVMGEQIRVDENLDAVFEYKGSLPFSGTFEYISTKQGALEVGSDQSKIPLHISVKTKGTHKYLHKIELPEYQDLLEEYRIINDITGYSKYCRTATRDWSSIPQRLKFLIALFRSNLNNKSLLDSPDYEY